MLGTKLTTRRFSTLSQCCWRGGKKLPPVDTLWDRPEVAEFHLRWRKEIERTSGKVPDTKKQFNKARKKLLNKFRNGKEWKEYQELLEVFRYRPEDQGFRRNTQIISKIDMGDISFILTRDLFQYLKIGELIFDVNSRFLEFSRRVYDYCLLKNTLDDRPNPELRLYMDLLKFKNSRILQHVYDQKPSQIRRTLTAHMALDKLSGVEKHLVEAVERFIKENPYQTKTYLSSSYAKIKQTRDLAELADSQVVRNQLKASRLVGRRKHVFKDVVDLISEEDKLEQLKEKDEVGMSTKHSQ